MNISASDYIVGHGDDIMATGLARGAAKRGKRIAFGDGISIKWGPHSKMIFEGNPNIAQPGEERRSDLEWVRFFKGSRQYNRQIGDHWEWNYDFRVKPGEIFLSDDECDAVTDVEPGFIFIEPHVKQGVGTCNKDWGFARYQEVVDRCRDIQFVQCNYGRPLLRGVQAVKTRTFREAMVVLRGAALAIVPEGGMHHAAAAMGVRAIVMFGAWAPPAVLGYDGHANMTGGATEWCGRFRQCEHCKRAMNNIAVSDVVGLV